MNSDKMKKAYPVSQQLETRIQNTLNNLPDKRPAKAFQKKRLVLVLTACLLLVGAGAIADSQWGILNYLRSMGEPTGDTSGLEGRVSPVQQTKTAYNTDVTISDAVFDGKRVAFSLEYRNKKPEEPVYIIVTESSVGAVPLQLETENDIPSHIWLPGIYFTDGMTQNGLFGTPQDAPQGKTLAVSITISVFKPLRPIQNLPPTEGEDGDDEKRQALIQQAYDEGFISLSDDHINLPNQEMLRLSQENGNKAPEIPEALTALGLMERQDLKFDFNLESSL